MTGDSCSREAAETPLIQHLRLMQRVALRLVFDAALDRFDQLPSGKRAIARHPSGAQKCR